MESIDIFYTHLLTYDNIAIVLPNGTLANGTITNYTQSELRRVIVPVSISYQADVKEARKVLLEALKEDPSVRKDKEMRVLVDALADSGVNLLVRCWVKQDDYWETKWRLTELVKDTLDEAGISIPFPQLDVHINRSE